MDLSAQAKLKCDEVLQKIGVLGADENSDLVRHFLVEAGWGEAEFTGSVSSRDRACFLLDLSPDAFSDAITTYNGNRLFWRETRENGFKLPEAYQGLREDCLAGAALDKTDVLFLQIKTVLERHFKGKDLVTVRFTRRTAFGISEVGQQVIQCDMSFGEDPVEVELANDGKETKQSLSFLSRIVAITDLNKGTLFIGCASQKTKFRTDLANVIAQGLLATDTPLGALLPIKVYPEKLTRKPIFATHLTDRLEHVGVSSISYRLFGASKEIVRTVRSSSDHVSIFDQADIKALKHKLWVYRAQIEFVFRSVDGRNVPLKRTVSLNEPAGLSYGRASPQHRLIINRVLEKSGLVDRSNVPETRRDLTSLFRFAVPQHQAEARLSLGGPCVDALVDLGILKLGSASDRAWCNMCGQTHSLRDKFGDDGFYYVTECPHGGEAIEAALMETFMLDVTTLGIWIRKSLKTDILVPDERALNTWFLGVAQTQVKKKQYGVILSMNPSQPEAMKACVDLVARNKIPPGVIFSLGLVEADFEQVGDWRVISLADVASFKQDQLVLTPSDVEAALFGRRSSSTAEKEAQWEAFFEMYEQTKTGGGHYAEAGRMLQDYPKLCPAGRRQLANRLKAELPEDFL